MLAVKGDGRGGDEEPPAGDVGFRPLRRDALANQERLLEAAVSAVLRQGLNVPMAVIAAEAGVGVGTLYRRFPTREALLDALTERSFLLVLDAAEEAAGADEPALRSLDRFLDRTIAHREQLVLPLHGGPVELSTTARETRARVHAALDRLLSRGREEGTVRPDLSAQDVVLLGAMLAQPLPNSLDWDRRSRRLKEIFLTGVRALPAAEEPP
jgi:AcrR family transcriptional regulator